MRALLRRALGLNRNEQARIAWLSGELQSLPRGIRLLDAGAGEQQYKKFCRHLEYVSQDFGQYDGKGDQHGLQMGSWDYSGIHIVSDITAIPEPDASFDAILCTEVFEHIPDPLKALDEFRRLLKSGGTLILTAPFASLVHFAPYYFSNGFSRYWYEHHLRQRGFDLVKLEANGDWYEFLSQEIARLPGMLARRSRLISAAFMPLALLMLIVVRISGLLGGRARTTDVAVLGYHCVARKE
jgi:SAM-dependent methyltransferase